MVTTTLSPRPLTRASKQLGDFGEGLASYLFIRKGYEVAVVDHVGADLIVEKGDRRFAVSVKTRLFRSGSVESRGFVVEDAHLDKLDYFAKKFNLIPLFTHVVAIADNAAIQAYTIAVDNLRQRLPHVKHGYSLRPSSEEFEQLIKDGIVDYSCWIKEQIGTVDF